MALMELVNLAGAPIQVDNLTRGHAHPFPCPCRLMQKAEKKEVIVLEKENEYRFEVGFDTHITLTVSVLSRRSSRASMRRP